MNREPSGGIKFLVVMLYVIGVILQAVIIYSYLSEGIDLMVAAASGDVAAVKSLGARGANLDEKDKDGKTALMYAAEGGHVETVKYLIEKGANVNAKAKNGKTAMMYASEKGRTEVVQILKNAGARE
jgi:ankyrin repeat protein